MPTNHPYKTTGPTAQDTIATMRARAAKMDLHEASGELANLVYAKQSLSPMACVLRARIRDLRGQN